MPVALTRLPSYALQSCQLTFLERQGIDFRKALKQHAAYREALHDAGLHVITLEEDPGLPDSVFIEDCAVILDEIAVLTFMGSAVRRPEVRFLAPELVGFRPLANIPPPAVLEGGDVLRVGRSLFVGVSTRTDRAGAAALDEIVCDHGYRVIPVTVNGSLHFKTACTALDDETLLINPSWVDTQPLGDFRLVEIAAEEPWGANALRLKDRLILSAAYPETARKVTGLGYPVQTVDISEFHKAEGGLTCLSLIID